jgi:hypothetical protein
MAQVEFLYGPHVPLNQAPTLNPRHLISSYIYKYHAVYAAPLCRNILTAYELLQRNYTRHAHKCLLNFNTDMIRAGLLTPPSLKVCNC